MMRRRLGTVLTRVRQLRGNHPGTVLVTGYWNVFQDGEVARRAYPAPGVRASLRLHPGHQPRHPGRRLVGGRHVRRPVPALPGGARGITPLLASDGDHPSGHGDDVIASTLLRQGLPEVPGQA